MLTTRLPNPSFVEEYKLDIKDYSEEQQKEYLAKNMQQAAFWSEASIPVKLYGSTHMEFRGNAQIHQNWALLRQNELLLRQNERIIQLLESMASAQGAAVPSTCPNCSSATNIDTAFCSQCGHKLAD